MSTIVGTAIRVVCLVYLTAMPPQGVPVRGEGQSVTDFNTIDEEEIAEKQRAIRGVATKGNQSDIKAIQDTSMYTEDSCKQAEAQKLLCQEIQMDLDRLVKELLSEVVTENKTYLKTMIARKQGIYQHRRTRLIVLQEKCTEELAEQAPPSVKDTIAAIEAAERKPQSTATRAQKVSRQAVASKEPISPDVLRALNNANDALQKALANKALRAAIKEKYEGVDKMLERLGEIYETVDKMLLGNEPGAKTELGNAHQTLSYILDNAKTAQELADFDADKFVADLGTVSDATTHAIQARKHNSSFRKAFDQANAAVADALDASPVWKNLPGFEGFSDTLVNFGRYYEAVSEQLMYGRDTLTVRLEPLASGDSKTLNASEALDNAAEDLPKIRTKAGELPSIVANTQEELAFTKKFDVSEFIKLLTTAKSETQKATQAIELDEEHDKGDKAGNKFVEDITGRALLQSSEKARKSASLLDKSLTGKTCYAAWCKR